MQRRRIEPEEPSRFGLQWWQLLVLMGAMFTIGGMFVYVNQQIGVGPVITERLDEMSCTQLIQRAELWFNIAHNTDPVPSGHWASVANMYFNAYFTGCLVG